MSAPASTSEGRPKLVLKPRDEVAAKQLEMQRSQSLGKSPFGDAKPREAIIASRVGKTEDEILREEVKAERLKLRLNPQQLEEQRAAEAAIDEVKELIAAEGEGSGKADLLEELSAREAALDQLMDGFAKLALEAAARGEVQRPSERRREQLQRENSGGYPGQGMPGMPGGGGRGSFHDRGSGYGGDRGGYSPGYGGRGGGGGGSFGERRGGGSAYDDRRGGYDDRRGGYDDRRGPPDDRRGGGFYGDKRGSYEGGRREFNGEGGPRGFSNYQERGAGGGGGSFDERRGGDFGGRRGGGGGGGGGYRDYNGPSDRNNAETFGIAASGAQYSRGRREYGNGGYGGGGGGGGGYRDGGGFADESRGYPGMSGDAGEYVSPYDRGEGGGYVQDRY